jgi:hypothetical protein
MFFKSFPFANLVKELCGSPNLTGAGGFGSFITDISLKLPIRLIGANGFSLGLDD